MKNHLKCFERMKKVLFFISLMFSLTLWGSNTDVSQEDLDAMRFSEMLSSVPLGNFSSEIQKHQEKIARQYLLDEFDSEEKREKGFRVESTRNKEVLLVTIPASALFAPNSKELLPQAGEKILSHFKIFLKDPDVYRVLLVMHTDNTGSELYREVLTEDRVDAVFDWFENQGCDTSFLFPYAMADYIPVLPNDSQENRNKNRRLEIYLMPGGKMVQSMNKKGK